MSDALADAAVEVRASARVILANAPVSYGAFEVTVGRNPFVPDSDQLLAAVSAAGYTGIDLGPPGYLGTPDTLPARLRDSGLQLAGAYLQLPFSEPEALERQWPELLEFLDTLDALEPQALAPKPTLADAGSPERQQRPGEAANDRALGLDDEGFRRLTDGLDRVVAQCRDRGFEPTFHPHAGTYVEAGWEIERLLDSCDVGICFDPGHLLIGGVDPAVGLASWGPRINHFHLKDARVAALRRLGDAHAALDSYYSAEVFCRLGEGDAGIEAMVAQLGALAYAGWVVVEQDFIPESRDTMDRAIADQHANLRFLRSLGL
jgi:inosose dehydratase